MSTTDNTAPGRHDDGPLTVPVVTVPVLVCVLTAPGAAPTDATALATMISLVVIGGGPDPARYRVGGRYAGLLRHVPDLDTPEAIVVCSQPDQAPPVCDGGTLGWLETPPTHTPDGDLIRVVTPDGRWHGPLPWEPDSTAEIRTADPPPLTHLRSQRWSTFVVMVEVTALRRRAAATTPPWRWPS